MMPFVSLVFGLKAGETPLFLACVRKYEPIVRLLIERCAMVDLIPVSKPLLKLALWKRKIAEGTADNQTCRMRLDN